ncbi:MAG TPA: alanine dehydrogenase, partial [Phycisphaerae bacterium]|nr:alanine dehydrogenase [Phycisphaerae bacterium]
ALCNATFPYVEAIAQKGWEKAAEEDTGLAAGLNMHDGNVTNAAVAEALAARA